MKNTYSGRVQAPAFPRTTCCGYCRFWNHCLYSSATRTDVSKNLLVLGQRGRGGGGILPLLALRGKVSRGPGTYPAGGKGAPDGLGHGPVTCPPQFFRHMYSSLRMKPAHPPECIPGYEIRARHKENNHRRPVGGLIACIVFIAFIPGEFANRTSPPSHTLSRGILSECRCLSSLCSPSP